MFFWVLAVNDLHRLHFPRFIGNIYELCETYFVLFLLLFLDFFFSSNENTFSTNVPVCGPFCVLPTVIPAGLGVCGFPVCHHAAFSSPCPPAHAPVACTSWCALCTRFCLCPSACRPADFPCHFRSALSFQLFILFIVSISLSMFSI